jgi:threonine dehydrogenase-like Zn-dependent dehydrogenase
MQALAKNGILVLSSVTGGDRTVEVPADKINLDFVLGNRVAVGTVNANKEHFEVAVRDLAQGRAQYPGWLERLITTRVDGLDNFTKAFEALNDRTNVKVVVEVAAEVAAEAAPEVNAG